MTTYQHAIVDGSKIFYREAGPKNAPAILLLHGFPTSSHMFRNLIPALADRYHVVAPDLPGFGFSQAPDRKQFRYTFEHLAKVIDNFTQTIGLERYAIYVFDYGAPVGHCWLGPAMTRSSSTYSWTMQATSPSTRSSRNISA